MRVATGKGNAAKKVLTYYRVNFGLKAPYNVLCDGGIIHAALTQNLYLRDALPTLFGCAARPVVTLCVLEELRSLGDATAAAALFAKRLGRTMCRHEGRVGAAECVLAAAEGVGVVSTNDVAVMWKVRAMPGVAVVGIVGEGKFVLMPPGGETIEKVREMEGLKVGVQRPDEVRKIEEEKERVMALRRERKEERDAKKKKRPKGPNPLSMKKSKKAKVRKDEMGKVLRPEEDEEIHVPPAVSAVAEGKASWNGRMKPKRVRKRRPKPVLKVSEAAEEKKSANASDELFVAEGSGSEALADVGVGVSVPASDVEAVAGEANVNS